MIEFSNVHCKHIWIMSEIYVYINILTNLGTHFLAVVGIDYRFFFYCIQNIFINMICIGIKHIPITITNTRFKIKLFI